MSFPSISSARLLVGSLAFKSRSGGMDMDIVGAVLLGLLAAGNVRAVTITEILYNPGPLDFPDGSVEYVEIFNDSSIVVDLSGAYFSDGIDFRFPENTYLEARSYLAVCASLEHLRRRFGEVPAMGNFAGRLDSGGERIQLVTATGSPLAEVDYGDRGEWPAATDGTGFSLCLRNPFADPSLSESWTWSARPGGTPGSENFPAPRPLDKPVFPEKGADAVWKYHKGWNEATAQVEAFSDPPGAWKEPGFDDAAWPEGPTPIGFGEQDIATRLSDMLGNYLAFAARKRFTVSSDELAEMDSLVLSIRLDDGCVVYFNGEEIGRLNLPGEAGTEVPVDAKASGAREEGSKPAVFLISKEKVHTGENVLAVQVHNYELTSNDVAFSPSLFRRLILSGLEPPEPTVVINELVSRASSGLRALELYNTQETEADLQGYRVCPSPGDSRCFTFAAPTLVPPGGFISVREEVLGFGISGETVSIFLYGPDGTAVVDAVTVEDPAELPASPQSHVRFPDGGPLWWVSTSPSPGLANTVEVERDLVLNEIHYNPRILGPDDRPVQSDQGDLVEIYNRSGRRIPLDGVRLTSGFRYAFPAGSALEAGGYIVVARDPAYVERVYGLPAAAVFGPPGGATPEELAAFGVLSNAGERIRLADALGNTIDEVTYRDEGDWDELADGGGSSLELMDPRADNERALAWGASDESQRAPWTEVSYEAPYSLNILPSPMESEFHLYLLSEGECLIDDISVQAGSSPVEYLQNGDFETDTRPWRITGTHIRSVRTTDEARSGQACLRIVATGAGDNRVNHIEVDTLRQLGAGPVRVSLWARWLKGSNALHVSGFNNVLGKTVWLSMPQDTGSPGKENGRLRQLREETGSDNLGPVIWDVRHEPALPQDGQPVRVLARIGDPDSVAAAQVLHQVDGASAFESAPLSDDGANGDGRAGDGLYGATLPSRPKKTLVNFCVEATDAAGQKSVYPRKSVEHLPLYIVDDPIQSSVFRYRLLVNRQNQSAPGTGLSTRLLHSDDLVRGTFIFEESDVYYDVGLRYHGSPWNRPPNPKMFRVRFNGDRPFLDGAKRINISRYGIAQNEGMAYHLIQKASAPGATAPHSRRYEYFTMRLNGNAHGTVMAEIRPVDEDYAAFNWPLDSDGYAWKITGKLAFDDAGNMRGSPDWTQLKAYPQGPYPGTRSPENYRFYFNPALRVDEDAFDPLIELLNTMDRSTTPDAVFDAKIQKILNVEASLRVFAVRSFLADWDTIGIGNGQNAYLYYAPVEGRHYLIPWDMDHTFERTDVAVVPGPSTNGVGRLVSRPVFKRMYASILAELVAASWSEAHVNDWINRVNLTAKPGLVNPGSGLVAFLRTRRTQVNSVVTPGLGFDFAVTTPDPSGVASDMATLAGKAPLDVAFLYAVVGGGQPQSLEPTWSPPPRQPAALPTQWQVTVAGLVPGENRVEMIALRRNGDLAGSGLVHVYNTTDWEGPVVNAVSPSFGPPVGGTEITVRGGGFRGPVTVLVGTAAASATVVVSAEEIRAITPPGQEGPADVIVSIVDGRQSSLAGGFLYTESGSMEFIRGEVDGVAGMTASDAMAILRFLFRSEEVLCPDAADVNDDGKVNVSDAIRLIIFLFEGGSPPAPPHPGLGPDPTPDALDCRGP